MSNRFATICVLSFNRPEFLEKSIRSLRETIDYPCEVILHDDGSYPATRELIHRLSEGLDLSYVIENRGVNMGIGNAMNVCAAVAHGEYIFKADQDLVYRPHWLSTAVGILDSDPEVGTVSLFNYRHYDPKDERFNLLEDRGTHYIVDDFVSSIYGFRRKDLSRIVPIQADGNHLKLPKLAISKEDYVQNVGFGYGTSTFALPGGKTQGYSETPLLFDSHEVSMMVDD